MRAAGRRFGSRERRFDIFMSRKGAQRHRDHMFKAIDVFLSHDELANCDVTNAAFRQVDIKTTLVIFGNDRAFGLIAFIHK